MNFLRSLFNNPVGDFPTSELLDYGFLEQLAKEGSNGFSEGKPVPYHLYASFIIPHHQSKLDYQSFLAELNSGSFINFLERVTGSSKLLADPHFLEGGIISLPPGDVFTMPEGGIIHPEFSLTRLVTVLINMGEDWPNFWEVIPKLDVDDCVVFPSGSCLIIKNDGVIRGGSDKQLKSSASACLKLVMVHYYSKLNY